MPLARVRSVFNALLSRSLDGSGWLELLVVDGTGIGGPIGDRLRQMDTRISSMEFSAV